MTNYAEVELAKLLECPVCFEVFDRPRMLWCAHAFCNRCVHQLVDANRIACPLCRKITRVFRPSNLPKAYFIQDMLQVYRKVKSTRPGPPVILVSTVTSASGLSAKNYLDNNFSLSSSSSSLPKSKSGGGGGMERSASEISLTSGAVSNDLIRFDSSRSLNKLGVVSNTCATAGCEFSAEDAAHSSTCFECSTEYPLPNLWLCTDCCNILTCSRCTMMNHRSHCVLLAPEIRRNRKTAVSRWLREMTMAIDRLYTNRAEITCEMSSLKFARLLLMGESTRTADNRPNYEQSIDQNTLKLILLCDVPTSSNNDNNNNCSENESAENVVDVVYDNKNEISETESAMANFNMKWLEAETLARTLKKEFDQIVGRLNVIRCSDDDEKFLYTESDHFDKELNSLPIEIGLLLQKQERVVEMQTDLRAQLKKIHSKE